MSGLRKYLDAEVGNLIQDWFFERGTGGENPDYWVLGTDNKWVVVVERLSTGRDNWHWSVTDFRGVLMGEGSDCYALDAMNSARARYRENAHVASRHMKKLHRLWMCESISPSKDSPSELELVALMSELGVKDPVAWWLKNYHRDER